MVMMRIGTLLIVFGAGSFLLGLFNYEFRLLSWVDNWGPAAGNVIRVGLIALGAVLLMLGRRAANRKAQAAGAQAVGAAPPWADGQVGQQPLAAPGAPSAGFDPAAQPGWQPQPPQQPGWAPQPPAPPQGWQPQPAPPQGWQPQPPPQQGGYPPQG